MTDRTFWKGLAVWLSTFAVLSLVVGGVVAVGFLELGREPPAMDDLHVSNRDDANRTVRVAVVTSNGSTTFERTVRIAPDERVSFDGTTERGREYRLRVAVDDRDTATFRVEGPDDRCTVEVEIGANATARVGYPCA